ncbi:carbohydrate ABC transporter permease [Changpingibacter yushuensis]|uniref:carbohydrate ABC transporter permease n=1 Tax=Changpingibacter yushuensis TaxID=2758440 RepID=UPI00165E6E13|nr:carbohydrate ABC transporter permease [Changpingibacter yushuensis]
MRREKWYSRYISGALGWVWLAVVILPIYYIIITSLRSQSSFYTENPLLPTANPTFDAYISVFQNNFWMYFTNTLIVTLGTVAILLIVCVMVSYYIVRRRSSASSHVYSVVLLGLGIPLQAVIVPVYYMVIQLGLYDSLLGLILPSIAFGIPVTVLIMVNFMRDIPDELFDSMHVDGASEWKILWRLVGPLSAPAITTAGVYQALQVWNGFLFPLVLTQSSDVRVLTLSLWTYQGQYTSNTPAILAAVTLSALPMLAAYIFGRRQMVAGLTAGFGK